MFGWRITKYNPEYRNSSGAYLRNEWTSISDIGKTFDGKKLTFKQYLKIEDAYTEAIILFMTFLKVNSLCVTYLEECDSLTGKEKYYSPAMLKQYNNMSLGKQVTQEEVADIARLVLREDLWCKLENEKMFVHFGYDYYMYIGSAYPSDSVIKAIEKLGLFVEPFESPYLEEIEEEELH